MPLVQSFPPITDARAAMLILGSLPGKRSLAMNQYYAHPSNLFWTLILKILEAPSNLTYEAKLQLLKHHQIALWDVLQYCEREGSLDSQILASSEIPNDLIDFLNTYPIKKLCFNGRKAFHSFQKHLLKPHPELEDRYTLVQLPSTSPANASIAYSVKFSAWEKALREIHH